MARETYLQSKLAKHAQRQNKSILTFTIITVIFLPLSFFTSYFGTYIMLLTQYTSLGISCFSYIVDRNYEY